jgi:two-component sensor histidine kinase
MIRRQHKRFIRNSFLAVCGILAVIFLIAAFMFVRFVDTSIESELQSLIHFTTGGVVKNESRLTELVRQLGLDGPQEHAVGGTRFPTYLFQIWQAEPDPNAQALREDDRILQIRGEQTHIEDSETWLALFGVMLKSDKRIDRIESEELCYMIDRSGASISIAIVDYSGYSRFLRHLCLAGAGLILGFAAAFYLLLRVSADNLLRPAELAWENQERFVGDASHEIKTPLAIILSTAELGPSGQPEENERRFAVIRDEARRINLLITRMLESARIKNRAMQQQNNRTFSVSDAVTECALRYESLLYEQGVTLLSDVEDGLFACADENAFKQVTDALLDNAGKYTPKGRNAVVSAYKRRKNIVIAVKSEGVGIREQERQSIFNRFYRADEGRAHVEGSYGLGLAIAKNLIETMGGTIRCESDGETFTAFLVTLRAVRPPKNA